jgi:DNA-directed RNA polymerase subunit M/transcription elongation factor TFIIS
LSPKKLANLPVAEMASARMKREREEIERRAMLGRLTDEQYRAATGQESGDGIEPCSRCGSMKTDFVLVPVSTEKDSIQNFSCKSCGHHWKID